MSALHARRHGVLWAVAHRHGRLLPWVRAMGGVDE